MMTWGDMGWGGGPGWVGLLAVVAGIALLVGIILIVVWAIQRATGGPEDEALRALRTRYARGEIDAAQYEATAQMLRADGTQRRPDVVGLIGLLLLVLAVAAWLVAGTMASSGWRDGWGWTVGPGAMHGPGGFGYGPDGMMGLGPEPTAPTGTSVRMAGTRFDPAGLTVRAGEMVRWFNDDALPHTITAADGSWSSGKVDPGEVFERRFDATGTFGYLCAYHPGMTGAITVTSG